MVTTRLRTPYPEVRPSLRGEAKGWCPSVANTDIGKSYYLLDNLYYKPDGNAEGFRPLFHDLLGSMMEIGSESSFKTTSIDGSLHWILAVCTATAVILRRTTTLYETPHTRRCFDGLIMSFIARLPRKTPKLIALLSLIITDIT